MQSDTCTSLQGITQCIRQLLQGEVPAALPIPEDANAEEKEAMQTVNDLVQAIAEIHQFIEPLSQGDYHQRVDFMGQFSTAFNTLVEKLEEREQHLTDINDDLEKRVNERTMLLQAANRQLHKKDKEWTHTFDAITDRLLILMLDGTIVKANLSFCASVGLEPAEIIGLRCNEILNDQQEHIPTSAFLKTRTDGQVHRMECLDPHTGHPAHVTTAPLFSDEGKITGVVLIIRNIKDQKDNQVHLEQLNQELNGTVQKLETANRELRNLAFAAAHDLRTPLRGVAIIGDWLQKDYAENLDDKGRELLTLLRSRMKRMDLLVDGVLEYCQVGTLHWESVDIAELLSQLLVRLDCPDTITITREGDFPTVPGDTTRLKELFYHLLENAIHFQDKPAGTIHIRCDEEDDHWLFRIQDNGPGLDIDCIWKVFYIFYTLKSKDEQEGVGMGLALSKRIVEAHNGRIWAESQPGQGSTFFFSLPKVRPEVPTHRSPVLPSA